MAGYHLSVPDGYEVVQIGKIYYPAKIQGRRGPVRYKNRRTGDYPRIYKRADAIHTLYSIIRGTEYGQRFYIPVRTR